MIPRLEKRFPWWGKILVKMILSRIPMAYAAWQRAGLFRHGNMDNADYALNVFERHLSAASLKLHELKGRTILEIGPGDSIASAIIAHAYGAKAILIDAGAYANDNICSYRRLVTILKYRGLKAPNLSIIGSIYDILEECDSQYLTNGLKGWSRIPSESVDFVFSQAVLEHIRRHEFFSLQKECFRVMKSGGLASHRVDLSDHLGGGLNNLRFSKRVWESELFARSGFYTNRIQLGKMVKLFKISGFKVSIKEVRRWNALPVSRERLAEEFSDLREDELNISGFDAVLGKPDICVA